MVLQIMSSPSGPVNAIITHLVH